jgi:C1A family cysteine protease
MFLTSILCLILNRTDPCILSSSETEEWSHFNTFRERFNRSYTNIQELTERFHVFRENFRIINRHNLDYTNNFTMGINQFTDLTPDEFKSQYVGEMERYSAGSYGCNIFKSSSATGLPDEVDWRNRNAVTSVKDQGQCGSCWTFSSTGAIEGAWAISTGKLINLSEQELVDCAKGVKYGSMGCSGGQMEGAFKYVISNGQCSDESYPYTSGVTQDSGTCHSCSSVAKITSCSDVNPSDQLSLKAAVAQQPVSVAIEADTRYFQYYSGGILTSTSCGTNLDHGVLVVGYGTEKGQNYWIVKNSWGSTWGESGYIRIARSDSTNDAGICGISLSPSFPIV